MPGSSTAFLGNVGWSYCVHALQCLHLLPALRGFGENQQKKEAWSMLLPQEQHLCSRVSFTLLRAAWISTGNEPGELSGCICLAPLQQTTGYQPNL